MDRRTNIENRKRFEELRLQIARRLGPVCTTFPAPQFETLTAQIARISQRYRTSSALPESRGPVR